MLFDPRDLSVLCLRQPSEGHKHWRTVQIERLEQLQSDQMYLEHRAEPSRRDTATLQHGLFRSVVVDLLRGPHSKQSRLSLGRRWPTRQLLPPTTPVPRGPRSADSLASKATNKVH